MFYVVRDTGTLPVKKLFESVGNRQRMPFLHGQDSLSLFILDRLGLPTGPFWIWQWALLLISLIQFPSMAGRDIYNFSDIGHG
jgi:hypothetical protein